MRNQTKESRRLKDLIRIGVFSALWVVIGFLVAFTIGFFPPILLVLPCVLGIIGGIVYVVMLSKLTIPGGILISSFLLGICLFSLPEAPTKQQQVEEELPRLLEKGPVSNQEIIQHFKNKGIQDRTVNLVKGRLNIRSVRKGDKWYWQLNA